MTNRRIGRLALALLGLALGLTVLGLALAACSSSSTSAGPTTSSTTAPATTAPASTTPLTDVPPTGVPLTGVPATTVAPTPTTTGTPRCAFSQLHVTSMSSGAAGHIIVDMVFENSGPQTCKITGYPGVAMLDGAGNQAVQATRTLNGFVQVLPPGEGPPAVTLSPGHSASAIVEGTDVPTGSAACVTYPKLLVTPPNTTQSVTLATSMPGCSTIEVHPVVAGTNGSLIT